MKREIKEAESQQLVEVVSDSVEFRKNGVFTLTHFSTAETAMLYIEHSDDCGTASVYLNIKDVDDMLFSLQKIKSRMEGK